MTLGPAPWFRLEGTALGQGPKGADVGELYDYEWIVRGNRFVRFDCAGPLYVRFEDPSVGWVQDVGPFRQCAGVDGGIYGHGGLVAKWLPESERWLAARTQSSWPVVTIVSSAAAGRR